MLDFVMCELFVVFRIQVLILSTSESSGPLYILMIFGRCGSMASNSLIGIG